MTKYKTIMADPPWPIWWPKSKYIGTKELEYPVMPVAEIAALDVRSIADDNCRLFMWTTNTFLPEALWVTRLWGFRYKMLFTWCKNNGIGAEPRIATEHLVIGYRGFPPRIGSKHDSAILNWIELPRTKRHSEKPIEIISIVEQISEEPRVELFARTQRDGWDVWGNEIGSNIQIPYQPSDVPQPSLIEQTGMKISQAFQFWEAEQLSDPDQIIEHAGCSVWIEEDDPPTNEQLVMGLQRATMLWAMTPLKSKRLLFYAEQVGRYRELLLERLRVEA